MGLILDIAAGQKYAAPQWNGNEQAAVFRAAMDRGYEALDPEDRKRIRQMCYDLGRGQLIQKLGPTGAREVLMMIGILMSELTDDQFEYLLIKRRIRQAAKGETRGQFPSETVPEGEDE